MHGADVPGPIAYSRDGALVAVGHTQQDIRLLDAATGQQLATLAAPHPANVESIVFSHDAYRLHTSTAAGLHRWDLRELRRELARINLDWEAGAITAREADRRPVRVKVE